MPALTAIPHIAHTLTRQLWRGLRNALRKPARPASPAALWRALAPGTPLACTPEQTKQRFVEHFRQRSAPRFFLDAAAIREGIADIQRAHPDWRKRLAQRVDAYRPNAGAASAEAQDQIERDREHLLHFALDLSRALLHGDAKPAWLRNKLDAWLATIARSREPDAYSSPLLAVFRSISISWSLAFLGARAQADTIDIEFDLLRILLGDANFIAGQLGDSFPNNHLLADGFALWYLGTLYPEFAQAAHWCTAGEKIWLHELSRQIYADGTSFEHALHYHNFACEMASAYVLLHQRNDHEPAAEVLLRLRRMLQFQSALCRFGATPPQPGDSGDATLIALDTAQSGLCLAYGMLDRALFQSATALSDIDHPALERAFWLLGAQLPGVEAAPVTSVENSEIDNTSNPPCPPFPKGGATTVPPFGKGRVGGICSSYRHAVQSEKIDKFTHFAQGGFTFFSDAASRSELLFRSGPATHLELNPGHMHADLLSVYLSVAGEPAIVEAGTYTYRATPQAPGPHWREYFLSPYAHNGLCLNGYDPLDRGPGSFPGGPIQSHISCSAPHASESLVYLNACTESATPYAGHCRGVLQVQGEYWLVSDLLPAGSGAASIGWQFHAQTEVTQTGAAALRIQLPHADLSLALCGGNGQLALLKGSLDPLGGWVSPRYGELLPAPMARWNTTLGQPCVLGTLLITGTHTPYIESALLAGNALAYRITLGADTDYVLLAHDAPCTMEYAGIHFTGRVLWLRLRNGRPVEVRWLEGISLEWPEQRLHLRAERPIAGLQTMNPNVLSGNFATHPDLSDCRWP